MLADRIGFGAIDSFFVFVFEPVDGNYRFSNACEVENEPNKNLDTRFHNEFQNWSNHAMLLLFLEKPLEKRKKEKIIMVRFKQKNLCFTKSVEFAGFAERNGCNYILSFESSSFSCLFLLGNIKIPI